METNIDTILSGETPITRLTETDKQAIYNMSANYLVSGKSAEEVIPHMIARGMPEGEAKAVVSQFRQEIAQAKLDKAKKDVLYGGLWCGGGLIVSILSYSAASGGGTYFMFWGAVIFGAIQFFRGLSNQGPAQRELEEAQAEA